MDPNQIAQWSIDFYDTLPKSGKCTDSEWTVLATIVQANQNNELSVVALGTGTKCIGYSQMSSDGNILNDSHAEVICRRAFLRYLYNEMMEAFSNRSAILQLENGKFHLDKGILFHMFTTLMPCGDASIFPKETTDNLPQIEEYGDIVQGDECENAGPFKRAKLDLHRTGAKCLADDCKIDAKLPGIDYHVLGAVRTKPGRGISTLSASCSDKFAKWIHMGIQGNLISLLLANPIYLTSITIGNEVFSKDALERALFKRFENEQNLYEESIKDKLTIPLLYNVSTCKFAAQKSRNKQPCPSSIIYTKNQKVEVAVEGYKQGVTKKHRNSPKGRLKVCKLELFTSFKEVACKLKLNVDLSSTYGALKRSTAYAEKWSHLKRDKFKFWPIKKQSLQEFSLTLD